MSRPSEVSTYTPALGSHAAVAMAHLKAAYPAKVSGTELAELLQIESKNVFACLRRPVEYGQVIMEKSGNRNIYTLSDEQAEQQSTAPALSTEQLASFAKRAVMMLRNETRSSVHLAAQCNTTADVIDKALSSLVDAKKLTRVDVVRGGQAMFDYRWGSCYVPQDSDFGTIATQTPTPQVSAVADPTIKNAASPWRKAQALKLPGSLPTKPLDALTSGAELGKKAVEQKPEQAEPKTFQPKVPDFKTTDADVMLGWQVEKAKDQHATAEEPPEPDDFGLVTDPMHIEVEGDIVCAINSLGELVLDMDSQAVIKLYPDQARALKRFLGNTSILEELAAGGAL